MKDDFELRVPQTDATMAGQRPTVASSLSRVYGQACARPDGASCPLQSSLAEKPQARPRRRPWRRGSRGVALDTGVEVVAECDCVGAWPMPVTTQPRRVEVESGYDDGAEHLRRGARQLKVEVGDLLRRE